MADLRDQLRKAGLVSDKQVRQAKHRERLHAAEIGHEGIEAEKQAELQRLRDLDEERRRADRLRVEEAQRKNREEAAKHRLHQVIIGGWIREATAGSRRFFFPTGTGRISYMDLSDTAARRLVTGSAAIIETKGAVRGEFCVVADRAASEIASLARDGIRFWNRDGSSRD